MRTTCLALFPAIEGNKGLRDGARWRRMPAMRRIFSVEAKKKLWRPFREERALGL